MLFERPRQLPEALILLDKQRWDILAGGTDYYPGLRDSTPGRPVLDISAISGLRDIKFEDGFWRFGALVTWSDMLDAELPLAFKGLKLAARELGSIQIQNRATIAGNLCNASPAADGVPPLLTLNAVLEVAGINGSRRIALNEFILGNRKTALARNEMVTGLLVPESAAQGTSSFIKLGARKYLVISISMVAVRLVADDMRRITAAAVSVGACSVRAQRLPALEKALVGRKAHDTIAELVTSRELAPLAPISDVRASKEYRLAAALELVQRGLAKAALDLP